MKASENIVGVIDYGAGNILSITNALEYLGASVRLLSTPDEISECDKLVLPGVGSFIPAMKRLESSGFAKALPEFTGIGDGKKPFLGICLGMQLMFQTGLEGGEYHGLGMISGTVRLLRAPGLLVPHMGWNSLSVLKPSPIMRESGGYVYFVHSYMAECPRENILAVCEYGENVTAAVKGDGHIYGTQFHPEKSGDVGLAMLRGFLEIDL